MRRTPSYKTCELVYYLFGSDSCVTFTAPLAFSKPSWQHIAGTQMTRSATEQSVAVMDVMGTQGMLQSNPGTYMLSPLLEIHVEFNNGMWWAMPHDLSNGILQWWSNGSRQVSFIWDWQGTRQGSYQPNGENTSINRYIIDFDTMYQRNLDNGRTRKVKVVFVLQHEAGLYPAEHFAF